MEREGKLNASGIVYTIGCCAVDDIPYPHEMPPAIAPSMVITLRIHSDAPSRAGYERSDVPAIDWTLPYSAHSASARTADLNERTFSSRPCPASSTPSAVATEVPEGTLHPTSLPSVSGLGGRTSPITIPCRYIGLNRHCCLTRMLVCTCRVSVSESGSDSAATLADPDEPSGMRSGTDTPIRTLFNRAPCRPSTDQEQILSEHDSEMEGNESGRPGLVRKAEVRV